MATYIYLNSFGKYNRFTTLSDLFGEPMFSFCGVCATTHLTSRKAVISPISLNLQGLVDSKTGNFALILIYLLSLLIHSSPPESEPPPEPPPRHEL